MVHHTDWELRMNPADGIPEFIPPERLDPERKPIRNTTHHISATWQSQRPPPPEPDLPDWWTSA